MKIAVVHDWLVCYAGAERVLEQMLLCFPDADIYTIVDFLPENERGFIGRSVINTSFIQRLPFAKQHYRNYFPLMPLAIEQFDLSSYDVVISSSHAVAKGVITGPDQIHISYLYTPIRYIWDLQHQYLRQAGLEKGLKSWVARLMLHKIRMWDLRTVNGVDHFITSSKFIQRRIRKLYRRKSDIIHPPVDLSKFTLPDNDKKEEFYLTASRMVPYKRIDLIVDAFSEMPDKHLIVIGDGPGIHKIKKRAAKNVEILGFQPDDVMEDYMQRAKAFVFAAEEDFGITPLEAQACGTPVLAYGKGGVLETIIGGGEAEEKDIAQTGLFFYEQTTTSIQNAVELFENSRTRITSNACRMNAIRFSPEKFRNRFKTYVLQKVHDFSTN